MLTSTEYSRNGCQIRDLQVNLEFLVRDRRTFVTGETHALKALFGENSSGSASYKLAVATVCSRLAGVFASLKVRGEERSPAAQGSHMECAQHHCSAGPHLQGARRHV